MAASWLICAVAAGPASETRYLGRPLEKALLDLEARGLRIVFTSNVVRSDMLVEREPVSKELRRILDELLAPHGLTSRDGPNDTVVVVPGTPAGDDRVKTTSLGGRVTVRDGQQPVPGATVRILETGQEAKTDARGRFHFSGLRPGAWTLEARAAGFVTERFRSVGVPAPAGAPVELALDRTPIIEEELVVTPSRVSLLRDEPTASLGLSRDEILALPHLGDDFFRALTLLPGTLGNDVSAQFHVRGARRDETQILIDGQELYDAYHLKERDNAISVVAPATLGSADLTTGGFPAEYGDRMSGVLDMTTLTPTGRAEYRVGIGFLSAQLGGNGRFARDRGSWLAEVRRGATDLVGRLLGDEDPQYWDAFAKVDWQFGERHSLRGNLLASGDKLDFQERVEGDFKRFETEYESSYVWLTHQRIASPRLFFDTAVSLSSLQRDRRALETEEDAAFRILDQRDLDVVGLRQDWKFQLTPGHRLSWGLRLRDFEALYDYSGTHDFDNPLAQIRHDSPQGAFDFRGAFGENQDGAYFADRIAVSEDVTLEVGLRLDSHTQTDESHLTPRFNLAWGLGERSVLRLAWGRFHQSQRPYELQVEDGEDTFQPVERAEHRVLGFERVFPGGGRNRPSSLRIELYQREVGNPRTRYENLYEPINSFPEVEPDRVRIAADRALAEGVEIFVRGFLGSKITWWANYSYSVTEDLVAGVRRPRIFDQTHSLNLDLDYRINDFWRLNLAWRYHTGWPTTPLAVGAEVDNEGNIEFVPVLGEINSDRLSSYHRLDLRASRRWTLESVVVSFFFDAQNLYNRRNLGGFDLQIDEEDGALTRFGETWTGFLGSAGVTFEF